VRNEEECVCSVCLFSLQYLHWFLELLKEMPGLAGSGTPHILIFCIDVNHKTCIKIMINSFFLQMTLET